MNEKQAFEQVREIIKPFARNADALNTISMETRILEDLRVNSARLIDIVIAFEEKFNIEIDDNAVDSIRSMGDIVRMVLAHANARIGK